MEFPGVWVNTSRTLIYRVVPKCACSTIGQILHHGDHGTFYDGDIHACPRRKFDIVCFNFSLHYIFETREKFFSSIREIKKRIKQGGQLIGIIPDSEKIIFKTPLVDDMGNFFKMKDHGNGGFGEKLWVHLANTPYYADGPKPEPVAYKDHLVTGLEDLGFSLVKWESLKGNPISELYSKFIFVYNR